jgi:hypothetical protein
MRCPAVACRAPDQTSEFALLRHPLAESSGNLLLLIVRQSPLELRLPLKQSSGIFNRWQRQFIDDVGNLNLGYFVDSFALDPFGCKARVWIDLPQSANVLKTSDLRQRCL